MSQAIRKDRFSEAAEKTAAAGRAIQQVIDCKEKSKSSQDNEKGAKKGAMQAGAPHYPEPPLAGAASEEARRGIRPRSSRRCTTRRTTRARRS